MPMKYDKLFALMKEKGLTTYRIRQERIITETTLQKLREGRNVTTDSRVSVPACAVRCPANRGISWNMWEIRKRHNKNFPEGFGEVFLFIGL